MKEFQKAFGERLRTIRKTKGMTLEKMADKAGLSVQYIGDVERGKANPTFATVEKISEALSMKMTDLLDIEEFQATIDEMRQDIMAYIQRADGETLRHLYALIRLLSRQ